jgi:peroxiredoxin
MRFYFSMTLILLFTAALGQSGYKLEFKVKEWKDTTAYLGFFQGESSYLKDTAHVSSKGVFVFDGKKALPQGIYFIVLKNTRIFDFVVGNDQQFSMETSKEDFIGNMKVTGDEDNKLFFENQWFLQARHKEVEPFVKILQDTLLKDPEAKKRAQADYAKVTDKVIAFQDGVIANHPTTLTARILKSTKVINVPPAPKKADGSIDSTFQLKWYRQHFFDNFDLGDDAMLRLPTGLYKEKVKEYLEKLFLPQSDSVTKAVEGIVEKAKRNKETYQYMVTICAFLYQAPEIMGLDQVYVNIYKKYFASGEMDYWTNASLKKNLKDVADKISRAQIGTTAPNLLMQDVNLQPKSMYDIKKRYTIVYFFDPDCGHCRQETPKLVDFYNKNKEKYDLEVFAVSSDTSLKKLRDFIKEMKIGFITVDGPRSYLKEPYRELYYSETFPTVYILDDKKKVIARKLPVEKLNDFLSSYEKFRKRKLPAG